MERLLSSKCPDGQKKESEQVLGHKQRSTIPKKIKQSEKMAKGYVSNRIELQREKEIRSEREEVEEIKEGRKGEGEKEEEKRWRGDEKVV